MADSKLANGQVQGLLHLFAKDFQPLENQQQLLQMVDQRTGARYCECHLKGSAIISLGNYRRST